MNKSSAAKKSTFLLVVLLLSSLFSFSCGDGDGNSVGGVTHRLLPTPTKRV